MRTSVRLGLSVAALLPLLGLASAPPRLAALEAKADADKEQRAKLEQQARAMNAQSVRLYQAGKLAEAAEVARKALAMREKLYPASRFKDGHPDLASSLNNLGDVLQDLGEPSKALPYYEKALAMREKLYRGFWFKNGHRHLATSLNNLGLLLDALGEPSKALPYHEKALAMYQKLYPASRFKDGHPLLATSLNNLGFVLEALGEPSKALPYHEKALAMREKLYPASRFKDGHPDLALSLSNLGSVLNALGKPSKALPYCEHALAMREKLYPASRFKDGHDDLAASLHNLGGVLSALGEPSKALPYHEKALAMYQKLYPASCFKDGHAHLSYSLNNLGGVLDALGEPSKALPYYEKALAMYQKLYPASRFKDGHPHLALSLNNLGFLLNALGEPSKALPYHEKALAMYQKLYPASRFKDGHPHLALSLSNLGAVLDALGEPTKALPCHEKALAMYQKLGAREIAGASETQALAFMRKQQPLTRDAFLSAAVKRTNTDASCHDAVWHARAAVLRLLLRRQESAQVARLKSDAVRRKWDELAAVRRQVHHLLVRPGKDLDDRDRRLAALEAEQSKRERELARLLPELDEHKELATLGPNDLAARLPKGTVFLDFVHYAHFEKGKFKEYRYLAFVLSAGPKVRRVELRQAGDIDEAIASWSRSIDRREPSLAPARLRKLVWEEVEKALPPDTQTIYLCLDGNLARLPFAVLPSRKKGSILLEDYALAVAPAGPWLLQQLRQPPASPRSDTLLAVGAVDFGKAPAARADYRPLPETGRELNRVLEAFGNPKGADLRGRSASVSAVLERLPTASITHLATHGYFDAKALDKEASRFIEWRKGWRFESEGNKRAGVGAANPLGFVGLALAGANEASKADQGGILSGLTLLELPLRKMRLCVLSACETGRGKHTEGEGVAGLQRALHLAGCRNVVASLWKVDDAATAALMTQFYHELRVGKRSPLEALREAQLTIYRHPERIAALAGDRGRPAQEKAATLGSVSRKGVDGAKGKTTDAKLWAAFILSGPGN